MLVTALVATIASCQISMAANGGSGFAIFPLAGQQCEDFAQVWPILLFVNNLPSLSNAYCMIQTWSVAVEVQMYLVSPLVLWMVYSFKQRRPRRGCYAMLALLSAANVGINAVYLWVVQGGELFFFAPHTRVDANPLLPQSYVATWTRFSPYVSGMAAALMQWETNRRGKASGSATHGGVADAATGHDEAEMKRRTRKAASFERWLTALDMVVLLTVGALLFVGVGTNHLTYETSPMLARLLFLCGRVLLGWCVAHIIYRCNNGGMRTLNALLSISLFYPLAVLSYGAYLLHMIFVIFVKGVDPFQAISPLKSMWVSWSVFNWDFTVCIFFTFLAAALTYVLIEKPFMSLRPTVNFTPKQRDQKERMSEAPALQCV